MFKLMHWGRHACLLLKIIICVCCCLKFYGVFLHELQSRECNKAEGTMKRQSSVVQTQPVVSSVHNKISRSWLSETLGPQNGLVSPMQQSHDISPCTVRLSPDFGILGVGCLVNGFSNDNMSSATNTSVSPPSVSFSHTSKGQLRYNRHEDLVCHEN